MLCSHAAVFALRSPVQAPSLLCSACDKLGEFVDADDALVGECRGCCTEEVSSHSGTYAKATLDICR